jgi:hypothetical protein
MMPAWEATTSPPSYDKGLMWSFAPADRPASHDSVRLRNPRIEKANPRRSLRGRVRGSASEELL